MSTIEERESTCEKLLSALVGHYIAAGRSHELNEIELKARRGLSRKERVWQMIAMAKAKVSNLPISKLGYRSNNEGT